MKKIWKSVMNILDQVGQYTGFDGHKYLMWDNLLRGWQVGNLISSVIVNRIYWILGDNSTELLNVPD